APNETCDQTHRPAGVSRMISPSRAFAGGIRLLQRRTPVAADSDHAPIPSGRSVQGAFWEREGASGVPKGALQHRIGRGDGRHQHAVSANGWVAAAAPCAGNSQNLPAPMKKSGIIWGVVAVLLVGGAAAIFAIAWRPAIAAVDPAAK